MLKEHQLAHCDNRTTKNLNGLVKGESAVIWGPDHSKPWVQDEESGYHRHYLWNGKPYVLLEKVYKSTHTFNMK